MSVESRTEFPVVSMSKFTVLFFATAGLYAFFWFYMAWRAYQRETQRGVFCAGRTVFAVFFVHELFAQIERKNQQQEQPYLWSPAAKAWTFIFGGIFQFIVYGLTDPNAGPQFTLTLVVSIVSTAIQYYAMYSAQLVINRNAGDPYGTSNKRLNIGNRIFLIFGLYFWFYFAYVVYLEQTDQLPPPVAADTVRSQESTGQSKPGLVQ